MCVLDSTMFRLIRPRVIRPYWGVEGPVPLLKLLSSILSSTAYSPPPPYCMLLPGVDTVAIYVSRAANSSGLPSRIATHGISVQRFTQYSPGSHCPGLLRLRPVYADHALHSVGMVVCIASAPDGL